MTAGAVQYTWALTGACCTPKCYANVELCLRCHVDPYVSGIKLSFPSIYTGSHAVVCLPVWNAIIFWHISMTLCCIMVDAVLAEA